MITRPRLLTHDADPSPDSWIADVAQRLADVPGILGVTLGGSRARGEHRPDSDVDLGLYYRGEFDLPALRALAATFGGEVTERGGWGPWVDGGGWLSIEGTAVDWIYRDLDRVAVSVLDASAGRIALHAQLGHPDGVTSVSYAAELAIARVLEDRYGVLAALRPTSYPPALAEAMVSRLGEADFWLGVKGTDPVYAAGCIFRAIMVCNHALHGRAERWLINEKAATEASSRLSIAPRDYAARAAAAIAGPDVAAARELVDAVRAAVER